MTDLPMLSELPTFTQPNIHWEQYVTPLDIVEIMVEQTVTFTEKNVVDMGVGTGRLTYSSLQMGAKHVIGIDIDNQVIKELQQFIYKHQNEKQISLINTPIEFLPFRSKAPPIAHIAIMNPPFGTKRTGIDVVFLRKAFSLAPIVISLHKAHAEVRRILAMEAERQRFTAVLIKKDIVLNLGRSYEWHQHKNYPVKVDLYLFQAK